MKVHVPIGGEISSEADQALDALLRELLIGLVERELEAERAAQEGASPTGPNRDGKSLQVSTAGGDDQRGQ